MMYIQKSCRIHDRRVMVDGQTCFEASDGHASGTDFLADAFRSMGIDYRKFYKMDPLSRLGFLAAELILPQPAEADPSGDRAYQRTIPAGDDFFPSPSDFVYTLPNIVTGEIAIRHHIQGETAFYVLRAFNPETICHIVRETIADADLHRAFVGWIDIDTDRLDARAMLCVDRPHGNSPELTPEALLQLFP